MKFAENIGALKKFRNTVWKFQQTFQTPLNDLQTFTSIIVASGPLTAATIAIDIVVFEPKHLLDLEARYSIPTTYQPGTSLTAERTPEIQELLSAVLADSIDFVFIPDPKPFTIFADHDEFTTFYAQTRSNLNRVVNPLVEAGFKQIQNYRRQL